MARAASAVSQAGLWRSPRREQADTGRHSVAGQLENAKAPLMAMKRLERREQAGAADVLDAAVGGEAIAARVVSGMVRVPIANGGRMFGMLGHGGGSFVPVTMLNSMTDGSGRMIARVRHNGVEVAVE